MKHVWNIAFIIVCVAGFMALCSMGHDTAVAACRARTDARGQHSYIYTLSGCVQAR